MTRRALVAVLGCALLAAAHDASAAEITPAVVFDMGGKYDKSFNEAVFFGVEKFRNETGIRYLEIEITAEADREPAIAGMAGRGADPVLVVGMANAPAVERVARAHPKSRFAIIDAIVDLPNVRSIMFKEHEGSFLVGILAAMASKTGKVGFVGGMDVPLIRRFACGYLQGAKYASAGIEMLQEMAGTTPLAWADPARGAGLARGQFERGVDVVFAAAGATGIGVYRAAADGGKLAIGVDSNQNGLHPGFMLTSMLKRVDVAAYTAFMDARNDRFTAGARVLGLAEGGVDWALDEFNKPLISAAMLAAVDRAKAGIIGGTIPVHDYMASNSCPG